MSDSPSVLQAADHPLQAVRHELDAFKVRKSVAEKIAGFILQRRTMEEQAAKDCTDYEEEMKTGKSRRWVKPPRTPEKVALFYEDMCRKERTHYATVRVIELPQKGKRFVLAYGPVPTDQGTGPFATFEEAGNWFYNGGR
ncbi:hypothetical protein [Comamonas thiooxydans]|uniref:hypothetical protein n=1 Tax=Comamonas thiooxydans TaxID=363952 RepID=UPI000B414666|nr:hypothetical protein [Comamonas thiooxydans]